MIRDVVCKCCVRKAKYSFSDTIKQLLNRGSIFALLCKKSVE